VYCLAEHHEYQSNASSFQLLMQAIQLIPENVMLRAQKRADEEPLRLDKNWVTACCIFVLWDIFCSGHILLAMHKVWHALVASSLVGCSYCSCGNHGPR